MSGRLPPGPGRRFPFGSLGELQRDALGFLAGLRARFGDVSSFHALFWRFVLVSHPDQARRVLQENHRGYTKNTIDYRMLKHFLGEGLLTADGPHWLRQRRLIQPLFHSAALARFGETMTRMTDSMVDGWASRAREGAVVDVAREMTRLTLRIIGNAIFDLDLDDEDDSIGGAVTIVNRHFGQQGIEAIMPWLPTPRVLRYRRAVREIERVVNGIIEARRKADDGRRDLVSLLLAVRSEEGDERMSDRQVRDEVVTLLAAGHETTANALAWTFHLLGRHRHVEEELRAELARTLGGRSPTVADLPALPYTRRVIEESMRLYPPAWVVSRAPAEGDELGGYAITPKMVVLVSPYVTHRHPDVWPDPDRFDPDRFRDEQVAARPKSSYLPFGGGPRLCIGAGFAMMEAQLVLATVAQRIRLEPASDAPVVPEPLVTLRPRDGLPMRLRAVAG